MDKALVQLEKTVVPSSRAVRVDSISLLPSTDIGLQPGEGPPQEMTQLMRVLLGLAPPSEKIPVNDITFFDDSMNDSQREAVRFVLESPEVACIHGPPGSYILRMVFRQSWSRNRAQGRAKRTLSLK
jgi:DNA polymerase alpha-associated DNA helicase A